MVKDLKEMVKGLKEEVPKITAMRKNKPKVGDKYWDLTKTVVWETTPFGDVPLRYPEQVLKPQPKARLDPSLKEEFVKKGVFKLVDRYAGLTGYGALVGFFKIYYEPRRDIWYKYLGGDLHPMRPIGLQTTKEGKVYIDDQGYGGWAIFTARSKWPVDYPLIDLETGRDIAPTRDFEDRAVSGIGYFVSEGDGDMPNLIPA